MTRNALFNDSESEMAGDHIEEDTASNRPDLTKRAKIPSTILEPHTSQSGLKTEKQIFFGYLGDFMDSSEVLINLWPKVLGKTLDLWDLWHAATSQEQPPDLRDWEAVADALQLDWISFPSVTQELKNCFEANLGEFERAMEDFEDYVDEEAESEPSGAANAGSSPQTRSLKRSFEPESPSQELSYPRTISGKRMKYSKDIEIPSTPEMTAQPANSRSREKASISPILGMSPRREMGIESLPRDRMHSTKGKLEPETQDFGFDFAHESQVSVDSENPTPSQQLRYESRTIRPVPFSLRHTSTDSRRPSSKSGRHGSHGSPAALSITSRAGSQRQRPATRPRSAGSPGVITRPAQSATSNRSSSRFAATPSQSPAPLTERSSHRSGQQPPSGQQEPATTTSSLEDEIERFMAMGYPQTVIVQAFKATSMAPGEAGVVMESLIAGHGIPQNNPGVWTKRDDADLATIFDTDLMYSKSPKMVDRKRKALRERKRLMEKHGLKQMEIRRKFLQEWEMA
jgi:hypothetical protein